jgi:sugar lactone lactonase YvrE
MRVDPKAKTRWLPTLPALASLAALVAATRHADGILTPMPGSPFVAGGLGSPATTLSPDGATLWVVDSGGNTVSGFAVDGGSLTELPSSPTRGPADAQPIGSVVT